MKIETYFKNIMNVIDSCPVIRLQDVKYEKRGVYEGFIRGNLYFADGSMLHFREFIDVEIKPERFMYAYQFTDSSKKFVFRYDNTGHHKGYEFQPIRTTNMKIVKEMSLHPRHLS